MGEASIKSVYDRLGETYYSSKHKSVKFNNDVQKRSLYYECVAQSERLNRPLEELDVLNIGVGGGLQRIDLCLHRDVFGQGSVSEHKLVDFDISQVMLGYAKKILPSKTYLKIVEKTKENVKQIRGDARELEKYFKKDTFDIVIAALCDHIQPQEKMYCGALNVLKEEGVLITTYPHKKLATVIRKDIYGINPSCTRYIIDGKEYLLHSYAALPEDISDLFTRTGFIDVQSRTLPANNIFGRDIRTSKNNNFFMKKIKVFLMPIGTGALVNTLYTKTEVKQSFEFAKAISDINEGTKKGKTEAIINVRRDKLRLIKELLEEKGYVVKE